MADSSQGPALGLAELASLYPFPREEPAALLELSFGQVLASAPLLAALPKARLVVLVPDEAREKDARRRLEAHSERVRFVRARLDSNGWRDVLPAGFSFVCVSWGIEEVPEAGRRELLRALGEKLRPGGVMAILAAARPPAPHLETHYAETLKALHAGKNGALFPKVPGDWLAAPDEGEVRFCLTGARLRPVDVYWKLGPYLLAFGMRAV